MNLQPTDLQTIVGQQRFLRNSVGLEYKTAGGTLNQSAFTDVAENGYVKAGTAVYIGTDGLYVPWEDAPIDGETGEPTEARNGAGLTTHDVRLAEGSNPIVGVLVAGHPLEERCTGVTEGFKEAVRGYLRFDA